MPKIEISVIRYVIRYEMSAHVVFNLRNPEIGSGNFLWGPLDPHLGPRCFYTCPSLDDDGGP
jgi:hypothetical protein